MAFWNDPTKISPKQKFRWVISFGNKTLEEGDPTEYNKLSKYFAKSVEKPSYEIGMQQAKYLYSHTFNFPKRLVWKPIKIVFYDSLIRASQKISSVTNFNSELSKQITGKGAADVYEHGRILYGQPQEAAGLDALDISSRTTVSYTNEKLNSEGTAPTGEQKKVDISTQLFFYNFLRDIGYYNPEELEADDKLLRFRKYNFKNDMIKGIVGQNTARLDYDLAGNLVDTKTWPSITINELNEDGKAFESWDLHNCLISSVNFDTLDYGSEDILKITVGINYDWATLRAEKLDVKVKETKYEKGDITKKSSAAAQDAFLSAIRDSAKADYEDWTSAIGRAFSRPNEENMPELGSPNPFRRPAREEEPVIYDTGDTEEAKARRAAQKEALRQELERSTLLRGETATLRSQGKISEQQTVLSFQDSIVDGQTVRTYRVQDPSEPLDVRTITYEGGMQENLQKELNSYIAEQKALEQKFYNNKIKEGAFLSLPDEARYEVLGTRIKELTKQLNLPDDGNNLSEMIETAAANSASTTSLASPPLPQQSSQSTNILPPPPSVLNENIAKLTRRIESGDSSPSLEKLRADLVARTTLATNPKFFTEASELAIKAQELTSGKLQLKDITPDELIKMSQKGLINEESLQNFKFDIPTRTASLVQQGITDDFERDIRKDFERENKERLDKLLTLEATARVLESEEARRLAGGIDKQSDAVLAPAVISPQPPSRRAQTRPNISGDDIVQNILAADAVDAAYLEEVRTTQYGSSAKDKGSRAQPIYTYTPAPEAEPTPFSFTRARQQIKDESQKSLNFDPKTSSPPASGPSASRRSLEDVEKAYAALFTTNRGNA